MRRVAWDNSSPNVPCHSHRRSRTLKTALTIALLALSLAWPTEVMAAAFATVERIWVPESPRPSDAVRQTGEATRVRGEDVVPLSVGLDLEVGDELRSTGAQVRVRYLDGGQFTLQPDSAVVLEERGILQRLGEVLYQVEGVFRVQYGAVEAAVEGTRFLVSGGQDGQVLVAVEQGKVLVRAAGEEVLVRGGQVVTVPSGAGPDPVRAQTAGQADVLFHLASSLGEPRWTLGVVVGGTQVADAFNNTTQAFLRARVAPGWRLTASVGLSTTGERFHLPASLGLERRFGPTGLGVEGLAYFGRRTDCLGQVTLPLLPGVAAVGRLRLPMTDRLALETRVRAGWAGAPTFDITMGASLGLGL